MLNLLTENLMLKLLAFVFALILWFFVMGEQKIEKGYAVPLELQNVPEGLIVTSEIPSLVDVRISGPRTALLNLAPADMNISIDLEGLAPGVTSFKRLDETFSIPRTLKITRISPAVVDVRLEKVKEKEVPIRTVFSGILPEGLKVEKIEITPENVVVVGAGSELKNVNEVVTEAIDISEVRESFQLETPLDYVGKFTSLKENLAVEVNVVIEPVKPERKKGTKK
ncbi:MAG: YbbR domain pair protein [Desulfuromonas sp.]|nr:MAG: YbbR domain pair protein [Desulfuromonas sp.]